MAWQSEFWNQDDNVFHGYPIPVDTIHIEHDVDTDGLALPWLFDEKFYGYPVQVKISRVNHAVDYTGLLPVWLFDDKFYGYPHVPVFPVITPAPVPSPPIPYQRNIIIYDMLTKQKSFENNGLAILKPSKCEVTEILNGSWNAVLTHPIDEDGIWRTIRCFNHIKILGQIFTIISVEHNYTGESGYVTAYCEHITYKMSDWWIYPDKTISGANGAQVLRSIDAQSWCPEYTGGILYEFSHNSDLSFDADDAYSDTPTDGETKYQAIFKLISDRGGELFRNNFYFSVNQTLEGAKDNAFDIRLGLNMTGIKRKVDISKFCTHFTGFDNYGGLLAVSYSDTTMGGLPIPNGIPRSKNFSYENYSEEKRNRDVMNYFGESLAPDVSYQINLKDIRNHPDYADFQNFDYRVGNVGSVYDERLGGKLSLRITQTVTNGITGEVTKVIFQNVKNFVSENSRIPVPKMPVLF